MDYSHLGGKGQEWLALESQLPPEIENPSPEEWKKTTNDSRLEESRKEMTLLAPKVSIRDFSIPGRDGTRIEARTYRPNSLPEEQMLPIYVHFHGGGFFFGTIGSEDSTCSRLALDVNVVVVNVNYRHTPEFVYPTAWDDSEDAFAWVWEHASEFGGDRLQLVIGGVSAGAYMTASLMYKLAREEDERRMGIQGQVLMVPPLVLHNNYSTYLSQLKDPSVSSWEENEHAPILNPKRIEYFLRMLFPEGRPGPEDIRANPGLAPDEEVRKFPPATFGVCGLDPIRDEGLLFAKKLHENGIPVNVHVFKGVPHAYRMFGDMLPTASRAWDVVMHEGVRWALSSPKNSTNGGEIKVWQS